jgi:hypothetical protein
MNEVVPNFGELFIASRGQPLSYGGRTVVQRSRVQRRAGTEHRGKVTSVEGRGHDQRE